MPHSESPWDVRAPFVRQIHVTDADIDRFGHANNVVYLTWLERVAWAHSIHLGLDFEAYQRLGAGCVARRHELDYLLPTFVGDTLDVATWIAENDGRVTMWRHYQIVRCADQRTVLRGRSQWVCVDLASGKPRRQPQEFLQAYRPIQQPTA
jgi:acyl-CoA thioester hydrolase